MKEIDNKKRKALLDLNTLYFDDNLEENDIIINEDGTFSCEVETSTDGYPISKPFIKKIKTINEQLQKIISMTSRLKALGYPVKNVEFRANITTKKIEPYFQTAPHEILKNFNVLEKSVEELRNKYGDNYEEHIDEIYYKKDSQKNMSVSTNSTNEMYTKLKANFEQYKNSLPEEEKQKLDLAIEIYSSSLFVSLNRIAAVPNYQSKSSEKLLEECNKNEDFYHSFHERFRYFNKVSNSDTIEAQIIKKFGKLIDYSTEEKLVESLKSVLAILDTHKDKIVVPEDIFVYRGFATNRPLEKNNISLAESDMISTSLNENVANSFSNKAGSSHNLQYINHILVRKGTPYIMPINEQAEEQRELIFFGSATNLEKIGYDYKHFNTYSRTFIISPKERIVEKGSVEPQSLKVESLNVDSNYKTTVQKQPQKDKTNDTREVEF